MRARLAAFAAPLAILLASGAAKAAEEINFTVDTAGDLAVLCATSTEHPLYASAIHMCHGYLIGLHHFHQAYAAATDEAFYCVPQSGDVPSRNDVSAAFAAWVVSTDGVAEQEALDAVLTWASTNYPCQ
ncbi:MAG: Rap1a/Tai family immunity protein [Pseudomonadota bacterium]